MVCYSVVALQTNRLINITTMVCYSVYPSTRRQPGTGRYPSSGSVQKHVCYVYMFLFPHMKCTYSYILQLNNIDRAVSLALVKRGQLYADRCSCFKQRCGEVDGQFSDNNVNQIRQQQQDNSRYRKYENIKLISITTYVYNSLIALD